MIKIQFSDIPVVYEDDFLVVINKPHGILVVEDRYDKNLPTLKSILKEKYGEIFVTHRLDFGTSGVMIFAKDTFVHKRINEQFEKGEVEKEYLALVKGTGFLPVTVMLPISKRNSKGIAAVALRSERRAVLLLGGGALSEPGLRAASRIARATGTRVLGELWPTRRRQGAG
ncbi:MAG: hypothetical protein H5U39_03780, partial [Deferribacterales bacterium]|nr:hypothetical protein [Deferribacterales bacterium]